jgi:hypothetical protein
MRMNDFVAKIANRLWSIKCKDIPDLSEFSAAPREEFRRKYLGRAAELFFSNSGEVIHKWLHYLPIYDQLLCSRAGTEIKFLEIGVFKGGSLRLWREYFGEKATIFGIDINPECAKYDGTYGRVRIGSQDNPEFLRSVVEEMGGIDVVLDDGSHISRHQRTSFDTLFPLLADGGLYIIEDMHTAYWPSWQGGLRRPGTAVEYLKDKVDLMHRHYFARGFNRSDAIPEIESIQFFDSIAAVCKRRQLPRHHMMVPEQATVT